MNRPGDRTVTFTVTTPTRTFRFDARRCRVARDGALLRVTAPPLSPLLGGDISEVIMGGRTFGNIIDVVADSDSVAVTIGED